MRRLVINLVLAIAAFIIQSCVFPQIPFLSAAPNLMLILTFSFGFICGKDAGMLCGFLCGVLMDLFYSGPFGFRTLFYVWMGYANGIFTKYYYEDYIPLPLILSLVNDLAYNLYIYIFLFLIRNRLHFLYYFREIILPEVIFTTLMTLVIYRVFLFITRKMEELEKRRDTDFVS